MMSPVCKKCRNYVMGFPCPHCGCDQEFTERNPDEIKPIIPLDLQESFEAPPTPIDQVNPIKNVSFQVSSAPPPKTASKSRQISPPTSGVSPTSPPSIPSPVSPHSPPTPPIRNRPSKELLDKTKISTSPNLNLSVPTFKSNSEDSVPLEKVQNHFKRLESHIKQINYKQDHYETQVNKLQLNLKEVTKKLQKYEKSVKLLSKANQKLESIHKDTANNLKKLV